MSNFANVKQNPNFFKSKNKLYKSTMTAQKGGAGGGGKFTLKLKHVITLSCYFATMYIYLYII